MSKKIHTTPSVGLALGSGGARGLAHLGVIKTLNKYHIPINHIAGTSIGALVGGIYCATQDVQVIEYKLSQIRYRDIIWYLSDPTIKHGIFGGNNIVKAISSFVGNVKIESLAIPFSAVATNIVSGQIIIIDSGDLATAIRASISIPGLFKPVTINGCYLVDGGLSAPVPVQATKRMGAEIIIAVDLEDIFFPKTDKGAVSPKITDTLRWSLQSLRYHLAKENTKSADVVIRPRLPNAPLYDLVKYKDFIAIGEKAAEQAMPEINKLLTP